MRIPVPSRAGSCQQSVFNLDWVERELGNLRPYAESFRAWVESEFRDASRLLRGEVLQAALAWAQGKSLSDRDYQYLTLSQELEKQQVQFNKIPIVRRGARTVRNSEVSSECKTHRPEGLCALNRKPQSTIS